MRAVIYARYSSELQREASIEDQVRTCKARIEQEGWTLAATYTDHAVSGSTRLRPGYQKLIEDARNGVFAIVVAEALDRLSRDQEDVAGLYKHLTFAGVKLLTLAEGEISELHVGLKGTMNALFLKDLAQKVRRGLEGRVRQGHSAGGLGYGYEVILDVGHRGEVIRGRLSINENKAAVVRRIFEEYASGRSPRAIATALNTESVPGPKGTPWNPSTIYGNWRRGTGILNNELYVGRRVWNRQRFIKDPRSGKRVPRYNQQQDWVVQEVPELRLVPDELWARAKKRQLDARKTVTQIGNVRAERARRPAYLLSGLLKCGVCGGGFSKRSETQYACSKAHDRGTCTNLLRIRRDVLEASVLAGLRTHLMQPDLVREFIAEYHRELERLNAGLDHERARQKSQLAQIDREIRAIIETIKSGVRSKSIEEELIALEARKEELSCGLKEAQPRLVRLDPRLADEYRRKVANLREELNREDVRTEAAEILRSLIHEIRLTPEVGELQVELVGDLAGILAFAANSPRPAMPTGAEITLVAGEGFEPPTLGL